MANQKTFNLACVFSLRNKVTRKSLFSYLKNCRLVQRRTASELANDKTPTSATEKETQTSNINNLQTGPSFQDFLANASFSSPSKNIEDTSEIGTTPSYIDVLSLHGQNRKGMSSTRCNPNIRDEFLHLGILGPLLCYVLFETFDHNLRTLKY